MINKKLFKQFKKSFIRLNELILKQDFSDDALTERKRIKEDICNWFANQYMLYNNTDKIKQVLIGSLDLSLNTFNRINFKNSSITFNVVLTDKNKNGKCVMSLNDICSGNFTHKDFKIKKGV